MLTFLMLNSMLTSFEFDVRRLEIFDAKMVSMLHFSMFPYSILIASITNKTQHSVERKMLEKRGAFEVSLI